MGMQAFNESGRRIDVSRPTVWDTVVRRLVVAGAGLPHCTNDALSSKFQPHLLHNVNGES